VLFPTRKKIPVNLPRDGLFTVGALKEKAAAETNSL
jgi:hypothetical protein